MENFMNEFRDMDLVAKDLNVWYLGFVGMSLIVGYQSTLEVTREMKKKQDALYQDYLESAGGIRRVINVYMNCLEKAVKKENDPEYIECFDRTVKICEKLDGWYRELLEEFVAEQLLKIMPEPAEETKPTIN